MVAFAKDYLPTESLGRSQNRAESFFVRAPGRAGHGAPAARFHAGEKSRCRYDACQGASSAQSRQRSRYGPGKWETQSEATRRANQFYTEMGKEGVDIAYRTFKAAEFLTLETLAQANSLVSVFSDPVSNVLSENFASERTAHLNIMGSELLSTPYAGYGATLIGIDFGVNLLEVLGPINNFRKRPVSC